MVTLNETLVATPVFNAKAYAKPTFNLSPSDFVEFKRAFKGDLVTPVSADYENAILRWASNAIRRALIVAYVRDDADVALAVAFARIGSLPIAVRCGAHNVCGASSVENGVIIDLSRYMNGCRIDTEKKLAYVGGGAIWRTVDEAAIKHGLAAVAGNVNFIGVGGSTLGGGYGWLSSLHGLAIDNLVLATIATSDGKVLKASQSENEDLFWAIRGGGGNFGVVTESAFQLHEQRRTVYSGTLIFSEDLVDQLVDRTADWCKSRNPRASMLQTLRQGPSPDYAPYVEVIPFYFGDVKEGREAFRAFLDLNPVDMTGSIPYEKVNALQNEAIPRGQNIYTCGARQPVKNAFEQLRKSDTSLRTALSFELYSLDKVDSIATNATAFAARGAGHNVLCVSAWDDAAASAAMDGRAAAQELINAIASAEIDPEASHMQAYFNYDGDEKPSSERIRAVFGENYARLQTIKKKYDPNMVFSRWYGISPA